MIADRIVGNRDELKTILNRVGRALAGTDFAWVPALTPTREALDAGTAPEGPTRSDLIVLLGDAARPGPVADAIDIRDTSILRKMWKIGIEEVVAQTIVQLDGDVVVRLRRWRDASGHGVTVMEAHRMGEDIALSSWRHLVETALWLIRPLRLP